MAFSYPRFNEETDVEAHARSFLNIWNGNHVSQQLPETDTHASKIAEFSLTFDECVIRRHSQLDIATFATFDQVHSAFLHVFHKSIPQCEIIS